jgi:cell division protein FtsB
MWLIAWAFIKNNWKIVAIGLAIAALLGYIGFLRWDAEHWKTKYENVQLQLAEVKSREEAQKASNAAITRKYENVRSAYAQALELQAKTLKEKIKNDKELASIRLTLNAVELFNSSKQDGQPSETISIHDGKASPIAEGSGITIPLTTFFEVGAENDKNHLRCIKQVEDWQGFWRDYESSVRVNNASP